MKELPLAGIVTLIGIILGTTANSLTVESDLQTRKFILLR
jgi:hypothetical protein